MSRVVEAFGVSGGVDVGFGDYVGKRHDQDELGIPFGGW